MSTLRSSRRPRACRTTLHDRFEVDERLWPESRGVRLGYPSVVARLSDRVDVSFIERRLLGDARGHNFYTSEWGTLAAAIVTQAGGGEPLTVVSMAPCYNSFTRESGSPSRSETIGSVHRLISDLARLVGRRSRVIAAGDWTISRGWSTHPTGKWAAREALHYQTTIDRMEALGFPHLMPEGRRGRHGDVVTFKAIGKAPVEAWAQLDYVFATENTADRVSVRALNEPDEWGASDHCRILIELD